MKFSFLQPNNANWSVGIDLGATNVKVICFQKTEFGRELKAHGFFKRDNPKALVSSLKVKEILSGSLRVNLDDPSVRIRQVFLPQVPKEELPEIIKWACKDLVTGPVDDYVYRYHVTSGDGESNKIPYLIYAVPRSVVQQYLDSLNEMGLMRPSVVEPNSSALALDFLHNYSLGKNQRVILINLGGSSSHFMVVGFEGLLFSRPFGNISGSALTKQISRNLGVSEAQAENFKILGENGVKQEQKSGFKNTVSNFFTSTVLEIQRSLDLYQTQITGPTIEKIYFTGGTALLEGFAPYVSKTLNMRVEMLDPFEKIDLGEFAGTEVLKKNRNFYGIACGLAL